MSYPYRLFVSDPERIKQYKKLKQFRAIQLSNKNLITKIGHDMKPIRKDIIIASDRRFYRSGIMLTPKLEMEIKPWKNGCQIQFNSIFQDTDKKIKRLLDKI